MTLAKFFENTTSSVEIWLLSSIEEYNLFKFIANFISTRSIQHVRIVVYNYVQQSLKSNISHFGTNKIFFFFLGTVVEYWSGLPN